MLQKDIITALLVVTLGSGHVLWERSHGRSSNGPL